MLYGEEKREYQRNWMRARRNEWIDENGPCVSCGSWLFLEVDHIDPSTKLLNPSKLWSMSDSNPKKIEELAKCQVLCADCHLEKSILESIREPVHGDYKTGYGRGCRCDDCTATVAPFWREYRARKNES